MNYWFRLKSCFRHTKLYQKAQNRFKIFRDGNIVTQRPWKEQISDHPKMIYLNNQDFLMISQKSEYDDKKSNITASIKSISEYLKKNKLEPGLIIDTVEEECGIKMLYESFGELGTSNPSLLKTFANHHPYHDNTYFPNKRVTLHSLGESTCGLVHLNTASDISQVKTWDVKSYQNKRLSDFNLDLVRNSARIARDYYSSINKNATNKEKKKYLNEIYQNAFDKHTGTEIASVSRGFRTKLSFNLCIPYGLDQLVKYQEMISENPNKFFFHHVIAPVHKSDTSFFLWNKKRTGPRWSRWGILCLLLSSMMELSSQRQHESNESNEQKVDKPLTGLAKKSLSSQGVIPTFTGVILGCVLFGVAYFTYYVSTVDDGYFSNVKNLKSHKESWFKFLWRKLSAIFTKKSIIITLIFILVWVFINYLMGIA